MNKKLATELPTQVTEVNYTSLYYFIAGCVTFIISFFKLVDSYFKYKKTEKETFIINVVNAAMSTSMNSFKNEVKEEIKDLKDQREDDRKYFDNKFEKVFMEIRKS